MPEQLSKPEVHKLKPESVTIASSMVSPGVFRKKSGVKSHVFAVISRTSKLLSVFLLF